MPSQAGKYFRMHTIDSVAGRLFQAKSWIDSYKKYNKWHEQVLYLSKKDCLRLARINIYMARRLNRK